MHPTDTNFLIFHGTWFRLVFHRATKLFDIHFTPCHRLTNSVLQSVTLEWQCWN